VQSLVDHHTYGNFKAMWRQWQCIYALEVTGGHRNLTWCLHVLLLFCCSPSRH
jgi:hypothetical protein